MPFSKNHDHLYFDSLRRIEKAETVLCLIHASYQAEIKGGNKNDIVRMLKNAYELFRFDAGSYSGDDPNQFASQYTIGHELGIWVNSDLKLCSLAKKVAKNEITIKDYFDVFFLNYVQVIDETINHPLFVTLEYAKEHNQITISKEDLKNIYSWTSNQEKNNINGLFNMFIGTSYFNKINENELKIAYPIDHILRCCNKECLNVSVNEVITRFSDLTAYVDYLTKDHRSLELISDKFMCETNISNKTLSTDELGYNKIYYGIPGCGKSYYIENTVLKDVDKENDVFRTTFYLDYSNADFIGQIYPSVEDDKVTYIRVPGPFTEALEQAIKNPNRMIYLVIEEINRGNAAAIFGDTFQLLDRLKEDKNGRVKGDSEYPVSNTFIEGYFKANDIPYTPGQIYIPHNLTILATMNTSDQNVFPLDTAFKRRWDREKVVNDWNTVGDIKDYYVPYTDIKWKTFATTINNSMLETNSNSDVTISEDKQMGAYFAQKNMLTKNANEKDEEALRTFTSNVIDYLYNDVTKFDHSLLFGKEINSYDNLYNRVSKYTKALLSTPNNTDIGPHAVLSKFLKEDIVKKLEENAKEDNKDKKSVEENIETDGAENEGTEN